MKSEVIFQSSPLFIFFCVIVGLVYAFLLYQKKTTLSQKQQLGLAAVRAILVSLLCFLLVNPLLKSEESKIIPPTAVLAIDNSTSMLGGKQGNDEKIRQKIAYLAQEIEKKGLQVEIKTLSSEAPIAADQTDAIKFDSKATNLSQLIGSLKSIYEGQNLTDVIVVSDGIINSGVSPVISEYPFRIHTLGVGDSTRKKDIRVLGIYANQIAYLGNKFPIEAEISGFGYANQATTVVLKRNNQEVGRQVVRFRSNDDIQRVNFTVEADKVGISRYMIEVLPLGGEQTAKNNRQETYVEVIDGKEKILLVALAPHPDIKALKAIIEKNDLFELTVKIASNINPTDLDKLDFDVLLLHQLPDLHGYSRNFLPKLLSKNKPTFFVLGGQSDVLTFNGMQQAIGINVQRGKTDQVTAKLNVAFKRFNLSEEQLAIFAKFPSLTVPFGEYATGGGTDIVLHQQVGSVGTGRALLAINTTTPRKAAVLAGEGIWRWRLEEYELTEQQSIVDDIILKTIQLISLKDDKRKLRVYNTAPSYGVDEQIVFENEVYNNIYERVYNQEISLFVEDEKGQRRNFSYTVTPDKSSYEVSNLAAGVYRYEASATVLGKKETASGQFVVKEIDLEDINTTADFQLLRTLSNQTSGKFSLLDNPQAIIDYLSANKSPDKVSSVEDLREFINLKWLLAILLLLAATEWGIRKYLGSY